ncbi:hypothetical protein JXM67_02890 [candidate division WOR-3 bacterium]|nr:hypothetical protein [candidate division WOR-3 bacterium]
MKKVPFAFLATIAVAIHLHAGWIKSYGGELNENGQVIQETTDGGYIVFGNIVSPAGSSYIWLLKTDSNGDTLWTRAYAGPAPAYCYSGQQTSDGGYIIAGATESLGDNHLDIWLIKTNPAGDTQWTKTYGGIGYDEAYSIQQTEDEGYIITGTHDGLTDPWSGDMWLLKTDSVGDTLWTKTWAAENPTMTDVGNCVRQTTDGGYILSCYTDFSGVTYNGIVVMKTDDKGDTLWTYRDTIWFMPCVAQTTDGNFVATGYNNEDMFLVKLDSEGGLLWKKVFGDPREDFRDFGYCVLEISDGGYLVTGSNTPDHRNAWLLKTDIDGNAIWSRMYGEASQSDGAYWVTENSDGGFILTGFTQTWASAGSDLLIIKTDSEGWVAVEESSPVSRLNDLEILSPIEHEIVLRFTDRAEGFSAGVFDASGRKVDEIRSASKSGTLSWGKGFVPGVYFIREISEKSLPAQKVILVK